MSLIFYKIIAAFIIFTVTLIAIFYPILARVKSHHHNHHLLDFADAFASGVFLGAALFHMLPESSYRLKELLPNIHYPLAGLLCASGFLLLLFLERLSISKNKNYNALAYMLGIIIIIHSLIEGTVLGINTDFSTLSIIFLAILAHKGSEGMTLSVTLNRSTLTLTSIVILISIFSFMTPLGILTGASTHDFFNARNTQFLTAGFNAFAAGTFLYMSTLHHINHHQRLHEAESLLEFFCLLGGVSVMGLIAGLT